MQRSTPSAVTATPSTLLKAMPSLETSEGMVGARAARSTVHSADAAAFPSMLKNSIAEMHTGPI